MLVPPSEASESKLAQDCFKFFFEWTGGICVSVRSSGTAAGTQARLCLPRIVNKISQLITSNDFAGQLVLWIWPEALYYGLIL